LLQLPFIRLFAVGRPSVAIFFLLTGYVNSLKPMTQSHAGMVDAALSGLAKSSFRRSGRLILPTMIVTVLSWLICQLGAYKLAKLVDSDWIQRTAPMQSRSPGEALSSLFNNLVTTWTNGNNDYDKVQWSLTYLLRGSMMVYLTMLATIYVRPKARILITLGLYAFWWRSGDGKTALFNISND
jgi:hypothetical protein